MSHPLKCLQNHHRNFVYSQNSAIGSCLVRMSCASEMSDRWRVSLYMIQLKNDIQQSRRGFIDWYRYTRTDTFSLWHLDRVWLKAYRDLLKLILNAFRCITHYNRWRMFEIHTWTTWQLLERMASTKEDMEVKNGGRQGVRRSPSISNLKYCCKEQT